MGLQEQREMARSVSMREFIDLKRDLAKMTKLLGEVWKETPSGKRHLKRKYGARGSPVKGKKGHHGKEMSMSETMGIDYLSIMDDIEELEEEEPESAAPLNQPI